MGPILHIVIDPVGEVEKAYNNEDFFLGFILAVTYIEYEANRIFSHLIFERLPLEILKELNLRSKIDCLSRLELKDDTDTDSTPKKMIDNHTRKKMESMVQIRNKLMHPSDIIDKQGRESNIFLRFRLGKNEKSLLGDFKECYSKLIQVDSKLHKKLLEEKGGEIIQYRAF